MRYFVLFLLVVSICAGCGDSNNQDDFTSPALNLPEITVDGSDQNALIVVAYFDIEDPKIGSKEKVNREKMYEFIRHVEAQGLLVHVIEPEASYVDYYNAINVKGRDIAYSFRQLSRDVFMIVIMAAHGSLSSDGLLPQVKLGDSYVLQSSVNARLRRMIKNGIIRGGISIFDTCNRSRSETQGFVGSESLMKVAGINLFLRNTEGKLLITSSAIPGSISYVYAYGSPYLRLLLETMAYGASSEHFCTVMSNPIFYEGNWQQGQCFVEEVF